MIAVAPFPLAIVATILFPYVVSAATCYDAFDIVQVQDVSQSFQRFWKNMTSRVDAVMKHLEEAGPSVHFGLATFGDKNITGTNQSTKESHTLGSSSDYCLRVDVPLQAPNGTDIIKRFKRYQRKGAGAGDAPGATLEALYRALIASRIRWRQGASDKKVLRIVIGVTASTSHYPGDVYKLTGKTVRPFDITTGRKRENYDCDKVDYPSPRQFADLLVSTEDTAVVLFYAPGGANDSEGRFQPYESLAGLDEKFQNVNGVGESYDKQFTDAALSRREWRRIEDKIHLATLDPEFANYEDFYTQIVNRFKKMRC